MICFFYLPSENRPVNNEIRCRHTIWLPSIGDTCDQLAAFVKTGAIGPTLVERSFTFRVPGERQNSGTVLNEQPNGVDVVTRRGTVQWCPAETYAQHTTILMATCRWLYGDCF